VANQTCLAMGGFLVSIETPEENLRLYDWLSSSYYWPEWFLGPYLGLYRYDLDSYNFEYVTSPPTFNHTSFTHPILHPADG
jgi:hypothetical protein